MIRKFLLLVLGVIPFSGICQDDADYFNPRRIRYEDYIYHPDIRTAFFERNGQELSDPILLLGSSDQLRLHFDLLSNDIIDYSYRIQHCDPDWRPSLLSENDYLEGFYTDHITDYKHSLNTLTDYWHYQLDFPNAQMKPTISGNFLLIVYDSTDPDSIIISKRFYVVEQRVEIQPNIHRATIIEQRNSHQEADLKVSLRGLAVTSPYSDIKLVLLQNGNPNSRISNLKPNFATNELLEYNYEEGNVFEGGSEFRNFDIRTTRFLTQFIEKYTDDSNGRGLTAVLKKDISLASQRYSSNDDINGKFLNKIYESRDAKLEGDYIQVLFRLKADEAYTSGAVFVEGHFTDWRRDMPYRMDYQPDSGYYYKTLSVKQGYYDYRYSIEGKNKENSVLETEGSHYETRNEYDIFVYWNETGIRYSRLIGYLKAFSGGF
ncbi:MAG: DUF5103 domain-containing protein [Bacteroidetes bacterium]|nr:DUF5103 domain-containing protein [Bacteroidota bacterium]